MNKEHEVVMMLDECQYLLQNSKRSDAKQQLKLLEKIRAEWEKVKSTTTEKKTAGYDGTKSLRKSFLAICDIHKEGVTEDVGVVKQKWKGFNAAVQERSQILGDLLLRLADYKVVKAQLQEQKLLKKRLFDGQHSMSALLDMGHDLASKLEPKDKTDLEERMQEQVARFDNLSQMADERMQALNTTMSVAK
ncbi:hypothetical protein QYM36_013918 [Artemia franciscana]|uniref:Uncharacterized protein n=1 Tax=Artemia franciscana TaxID=6661 RepID=A0AA88HFI7_ARTSF|nr:hypothetical protein QYM36_013918 [Artemia franciscana]